MLRSRCDRLIPELTLSVHRSKSVRFRKCRRRGRYFIMKVNDDTNYATDVPIWEKYTLTIEEASKYFRIGENKLRRLAEENPNAGWVIMNGNRIQIKRKQFEKIIDTLDAI